VSGVAPSDERPMRRALALAERGRGAVEPNPMVGAVVLSAAGDVVGEGWHERFGGPHAEVNAFAMAGAAARGGTLFVTLEPCCHWGKTPPCTDAVLKSGVVRVVVAMRDPFPAVAGGGIQILRDNGLSVEVGLLEAEATELNMPFFVLLQAGRPWVIAKWAMSLDGKIATRTGDSKWISNATSRAKVHELRGRVDAILVGRGTLLADDPLLTARPAGPRTATRIVVTASGELPSDCQVLRTIGEAPVIVATRMESVGKLGAWKSAGAEVLGFEGSIVPALLAELGRRRMTNVLVEGGAGLLGSFRDAGLIDEAHVYVAPKMIGGDKALSPVGGLGIVGMSEATGFGEPSVRVLDGDVWIAARRS
jgi:diaminohydroxyphosphoribosylaminopyrimidine deaminase/5-amino-6-(5-phosphoribosylamino)uracil reductase